ncbi:hypothetical protein D9M69_570800 [compost metagenome]
MHRPMRCARGCARRWRASAPSIASRRAMHGSSTQGRRRTSWWCRAGMTTPCRCASRCGRCLRALCPMRSTLRCDKHRRLPRRHSHGRRCPSPPNHVPACALPTASRCRRNSSASRRPHSTSPAPTPASACSSASPSAATRPSSTSSPTPGWAWTTRGWPCAMPPPRSTAACRTGVLPAPRPSSRPSTARSRPRA